MSLRVKRLNAYQATALKRSKSLTASGAASNKCLKLHVELSRENDHKYNRDERL